MSITDELREWIDSVAWLDDSVSQAYKNILAIADRIDKQHRKTLENVNELQELYIKAQEDRERMFRACVEKNQTILRLSDEKAKLREELDCCLRLTLNCDGCEAMLDCWECLRADSSQKERKRLEAENAKLRELLVDFRNDMWSGGEWTEPFDERMRELGIEI